MGHHCIGWLDLPKIGIGIYKLTNANNHGHSPPETTAGATWSNYQAISKVCTYIPY